MDRRNFLKQTGMTIGAAAAGPGALAQPRGRVSVVIDPADPVASAPPVRWAAQELQRALVEHGMAGGQFNSVDLTADTDFCVVACGRSAPSAVAILSKAGVSVADRPECLALVPAKIAGRSAILACGSDARGMVYALLEIADRVRHSELISALTSIKPTTERPANTVRSISRMFVSDVEDKPWFNDREMWPAYLTMLATQRFNRFSLALGMGYDFLREVTDSYFLFPYPFFLPVPGYNVRASNLPDAERDQQPGDAEIHQRTDRGARAGISVGHLDARLPVGQQPAVRPTTISKASPRKRHGPIAAMRWRRCSRHAPRSAA